MANFRADKPFIYPKPEKSDPVGWDKGSFKHENEVMGNIAQLKKDKTDDAFEKEKNERMKVRFLSCDPGVRYSSNFRQKNNNEVRNLTVKHATHV